MRLGNRQRSVVWDHFKKNADNKNVVGQKYKKDLKYYGNTTKLTGNVYVYMF